MKLINQCLGLLSLLLLAFSSCQKSPNTITNTGCNYTAHTLGSEFKYIYDVQTVAGNTIDTLIETVVGDTLLMGDNYKIVNTHFAIDTQKTTTLYICDNKEYRGGYYDTLGGFDGELYLAEGLSVGDSWGDTIPTLFYAREAIYLGTSNRTVNGMTFNDVIHMKQKEYYYNNNVRILTYVIDVYYAKGIGRVELIAQNTSNTLWVSMKIHSYTIQ